MCRPSWNAMRFLRMEEMAAVGMEEVGMEAVIVETMA